MHLVVLPLHYRVCFQLTVHSFNRLTSCSFIYPLHFYRAMLCTCPLYSASDTLKPVCRVL